MTWPILGDHQINLQAIARIMSSPDDIVVAIVGGAMLEEAVERTLKERMNSDAKATGRLFDLTRPLSSTSAQIDALYMLWGIDEEVYEAMLNVYRVRNFFAHNLDASFKSTNDKLVKALQKLNLHDRQQHYPDPRFGTETSEKVEKVTNNRERFVVNLKLCLNFLMQDRCRHVPHSFQPLSHNELRGQVGDPMP